MLKRNGLKRPGVNGHCGLTEVKDVRPIFVLSCDMDEFRRDRFENYYDVFEEIGSGQFAVVRRCVEKISSTEYAAKFIRKKRIASSRRGVAIQDIQKEVSILRQMDHPNVISLHDVFENDTHVILVLELVHGPELFDFISEKERVSEEEASFLIKQILLGVQHMHNKAIIHLDLKPENVMLQSVQYGHIKVIDFGLSRVLRPGEEVRAMLGTPDFVAPEVISYEPLGPPTDMWAIGVITYMMLSGLPPFMDDNQQKTYEFITAVEYEFDEEYFRDTSELAKDFIAKCFVKDPRKRATVDDCLNHPWIQPRVLAEVIERKEKEINIDNIRAFQARRRWKHSMRVVALCNRLSKSAKLRSQSAELFLHSNANSYQPNYAHDENFVVSAILCAAEEGNQQGLEELLDMASNIDINQCNKHGDTAAHVAASTGQLDILKFLKEKGMNLNIPDNHGDTPIFWAARQGHVDVVRFLSEAGVNSVNKSRETCLHVASRYGHAAVVQFLCTTDINLDAQDDQQECAVHIAVWHGFSSIVKSLCKSGANVNLKDKEGETALHCAAARGHQECAHWLISAQAQLDVVDRHRSTPLHLALRRHHTNLAMALLRAGANFDIPDESGEGVIHIAARDGLLSLAQTLCAYGCNVDTPNKAGLFPLHLAAKHGHTEIVRCLCLAGCIVDQKNRDGIAAEITAIKQGHNQIADLLNRLRNEQQREDWIRQLIPSQHSIPRIKLKLFGHSGSGKSTLLETLKTGYFTGLFRRSKSITTPPKTLPGHPTTPPKSSSIELMDRQSRKNSLTSDIHDHYTKGIDIQQMCITGVGDVSAWEFSGQDNYYLLYDLFIGNTNCIHMVMYNLEEPYEVQLQQISFWLHFLQARVIPAGPLGHCGKSNRPAKIVIVGSHPDTAGLCKNGQGDYVCPSSSLLLDTILAKFSHVFDIHDRVLFADCHAASSQGIKDLKSYLGDAKHRVLQGLPKSTGFLEATVTALPSWRKTFMSFPVVSWQDWQDRIHSHINPLAGDEHLKELIQQLQLMGEVQCLKGDNQDLVVLSPRWLCGDIVGQLLSHEYFGHARVTGCYTVDDFQTAFPEADALDLLQVLEALNLCVQCDNDGEIEYEFPCFNMVEELDGLWDPTDLRYVDGVYAGVRMRTPVNTEYLLQPLFPRIQVTLRVRAQEHHDPDTDLYQWFCGSKFCSGMLEGLVTLAEGAESVEVKVRAPTEQRIDAFYFLEDLINVVDQVFAEACPGMFLERHYLSPRLLREHEDPVRYSHGQIAKAMLDGLNATVGEESLKEIVACDSKEILAQLVGIRDIPISNIPLSLRQSLCSLLDTAHPWGKDWCLLAVQLGVTEQLPKLDTGNNPTVSRTCRVLEEWSRSPNSTVGKLVLSLRELGREDVVSVVLTTCPLFRILQGDDDAGTTTGSASCSNLSR